VTGIDSPCVGQSITQYEYSHIPMKVSVTRGDTLVADETGRGTFHFRLAVPPGTHVVTSKQSGMSKTVTVHANSTTVIDFDPTCV
jgi:hypothetical protein